MPLSKKDKRIRNAQVILTLALTALLFISAYEAVNFGHEAKWTAALPSDYYYLVKQSNYGTIYVAGSQHGLRAFNPDGTLKWTYAGAGNTEVSANGTSYFATALPGDSFQSFCALEPDGHVDWSYPVDNGGFFAPIIGPDGTIYAQQYLWENNTNLGDELMAFSPQGDLLWKNWSEGYIAFAVSQNGTLLMNRGDNNLTAFSPNGEVLWQVPNGPYVGGAIVTNDTIYNLVNLAEVDGIRADLYAYEPNGSLLWRYPDYLANTHLGNSLQVSDFVIDGGVIYFVRFNGTGPSPYTSLFAMNQNGTLRWEYRDSMIGRLSVRDDTIVIQTSDGLTALNLDGHVKWVVHGQYAFSTPTAIDLDGSVFAITTPSDSWNNGNGIAALGVNPTLPLIGAFIVIPIVILCFVVIWKARNDLAHE
jgi:hypothetical protein